LLNFSDLWVLNGDSLSYSPLVVAAGWLHEMEVKVAKNQIQIAQELPSRNQIPLGQPIRINKLAKAFGLFGHIQVWRRELEGIYK
jgi:hypothetical protein